MIPATASSAIVRRSHASASSNAPPRAAPWIWQIVGFHRAAQLPDQLTVQRVALIRPIEDQMSHGAAVLGAQKCHVRTRFAHPPTLRHYSGEQPVAIELR
jgi:hypothetical protein